VASPLKQYWTETEVLVLREGSQRLKNQHSDDGEPVLSGFDAIIDAFSHMSGHCIGSSRCIFNEHSVSQSS